MSKAVAIRGNLEGNQGKTPNTIRMTRQSHRRNLAEPNETLFASTTVLSFAKVFASEEAASRMAVALIQVHRFHGAWLRGFVIMPEHIHFLTILPENKTGAQFVHSLKTASANWCLPLVSERLLAEMKLDPDSQHRAFWKERYHATPLYEEEVFRQKLDYIHHNPIRRGLSTRPEHFRYSSARFFFEGLASEDSGLESCVAILQEWPPASLPPLGALRS